MLQPKIISTLIWIPIKIQKWVTSVKTSAWPVVPLEVFQTFKNLNLKLIEMMTHQKF